LSVDTYGDRQTDYNTLSSEFIQSYEYIILLAGHSSVACCNGELKSPWNNNVRNFSNLIEKTNTLQKIIYASSSSVYGNEGGKVFGETDLSLSFVNNYDLTKISLDLLAQKYISSGRNIIGLRFGTVNGGSTVIRRDLMINSMVYAAKTTGTISVNNKNVTRPILSIRDLGRAMYYIVNDRHQFRCGVYNLASFNSTVDQISKLVKEKTGSEIIDKGDYAGIYDFETNPSKFINSYNFKYEDTVESIIDNVIDCYYNKNPKIVRRNEYFNYIG
jgi:nucleoside-diphosphate-sugar epimerase